MAINPVPAHYPGFIFDGENSRNYGVYITGVDIYGAPERDTELVTIPGRNGDYNLDRGRWKNTKITYECAMGADTEADFLTGIDAFRNMLASRIGYKRLEDEINTGEYRRAVFADGFDVDYIDPKAAAFSVVFECKPQRFLTTGETAQAVTSGGTVTNPTLYDSSPLLSVVGYGGVNINGESLEVLNNPIGDVEIAPVSNYKRGTQSGATWTVGVVTYPDYSPLVVGDTVTVGDNIFYGGNAAAFFDFVIGKADLSVTWTTDGALGADIKYMDNARLVRVIIPVVTYAYGTPTNRSAETITLTITKGTSTSVYNVVVGWQALPHPVEFDVAFDASATQTSYTGTPIDLTQIAGRVAPFIGYSTYSANTDPVYVDLDIGEAYTYIGGEIVSYNSNVYLPWKLPTLSPGANTITFDNTITQFKIVPRWWKL